MEVAHHSHIFTIIIVGILISTNFWIRVIFRKIDLSPIVGYIALGVFLRLADEMLHFLSEENLGILHFLGETGIVIFLFRIGLGCQWIKLLEQLRRASILALSEIATSGLIGFFGSYVLLGFPLIPSLFVGVAMTATSIGIASTVWENIDSMESRSGKLLMNMTALDVIAAVAMMGFLIEFTPELQKGNLSISLLDFVVFALTFITKYFVFLLLCYLLSLLMKTRVISSLRRFEKDSDLMLMTASTALIVAGVAGLFGFSLALGAFFSGIAFSRDPKKSQLEKPFVTITNFFTPFFFIGVGLLVSPFALSLNFSSSLVLLVCAVLGKVIGIVIPAVLSGLSFNNSLVLGISMVPRAGVAMLVMASGASFGSEVVPEGVFAAMVMVSLATSTVGPIVLKFLMRYYVKEGDIF